MNYRALLAVAAACVLVASGAFALLPFQAAEHRTSVDGAVSTAHAEGAATGLDEPVAVSVEGPGWAAKSVQHFLVHDLRAAGVQATPVEHAQAADGPILAVRILSLDTPYSPSSPTATVDWRFVYANTGNATYVYEELASKGGPTVNGTDPGFAVEGEYRLTDDVRGVVSIPAYRSAIADRVAATTAEKLLGAA